jgi:hypothetical protein
VDIVPAQALDPGAPAVAFAKIANAEAGHINLPDASTYY